jgi:hypothetical protein
MLLGWFPKTIFYSCSSRKNGPVSLGRWLAPLLNNSTNFYSGARRRFYTCATTYGASRSIVLLLISLGE